MHGAVAAVGAAAAEPAELAEAVGAAAAGAVAVRRGVLAAGARLEHLLIALTDAGRHGRG